MNVKGLTMNQAYDVARKEFYALRHEEEVQRRVAREEATWVGAYFGKGVVQVGMELEDKTYEDWKKWATTEMEAQQRLQDSAYTGIGTTNEDDVPVVTTDLEVEDFDADETVEEAKPLAV